MLEFGRMILANAVFWGLLLLGYGLLMSVLNPNFSFERWFLSRFRYTDGSSKRTTAAELARQIENVEQSVQQSLREMKKEIAALRPVSGNREPVKADGELRAILEKQQRLEGLLLQIQQQLRAVQDRLPSKPADPGSISAGRSAGRSGSATAGILYCSIPYNGVFTEVRSEGAERYRLTVQGDRAAFQVIEGYSLNLLGSFDSSVAPVCQVAEGDINQAVQIVTLEPGEAVRTDSGWKMTRCARIRLV